MNCLYIYRHANDVGDVLTGVDTALASPAFINLIYRTACVVGMDMTLPFKVRYSTDAVNWMELPFVDQLSVVSCICSYASNRTSDACDQISVMSSTAIICLRLVECELCVSMGCVGAHSSNTCSVRMVGVGSFFHSSHISFVGGLDPSS